MFESRLLKSAADSVVQEIGLYGDYYNLDNAVGEGPLLWCVFDPRMEGQSDAGYIFSDRPIGGMSEFSFDEDPDDPDADPWDVWWSQQPGSEHWYSVYVERGSDIERAIKDAAKHFDLSCRIRNEVAYLRKNVLTDNPDRVLDLSDTEILERSKLKTRKKK